MSNELDFSSHTAPAANRGGGLLKPLALLAIVGATLAAVGAGAWVAIGGHKITPPAAEAVVVLAPANTPGVAKPDNASTELNPLKSAVETKVAATTPVVSDDDELRSLEALYIAESYLEVVRQANEKYDYSAQDLGETGGKAHAVKLADEHRRLETNHAKKYSSTYRTMKTLSPARWDQFLSRDEEARAEANKALVSIKSDSAIEFELANRSLLGSGKSQKEKDMVLDEMFRKYHKRTISEIDSIYAQLKTDMAAKPIRWLR